MTIRTKRYLSAVRYIQGHVEAKGHLPSATDAARALGLSEESARLLFAQMREEGLASRRTQWCVAPEPLITAPIPRSPSGEPLYFVEVAG